MANSPNTDAPIWPFRVFTSSRRRQRQRLRLQELQSDIDITLASLALKALKNEGVEAYNKIVGNSLPRSPDQGVVADELTPHEKFLDKWRVSITALLVMGLFLIVGVIATKTVTNAAATPYVSLLSGLAGIALGWMFATSGSGATGRSTSHGTNDATPPSPLASRQRVPGGGQTPE